MSVTYGATGATQIEGKEQCWGFIDPKKLRFAEEIHTFKLNFQCQILTMRLQNVFEVPYIMLLKVEYRKIKGNESIPPMSVRDLLPFANPFADLRTDSEK